MTTNDAQGPIIERFTYDQFGHATAYSLVQGENAAVTITYQYDNLGNITAIEYPAYGSLSAQTVVYGYDERGMQATIGTSDQADSYAAYTYDAAGRPQTVTLANGTAHPHYAQRHLHLGGSVAKPQ